MKHDLTNQPVGCLDAVNHVIVANKYGMNSEDNESWKDTDATKMQFLCGVTPDPSQVNKPNRKLPICKECQSLMDDALQLITRVKEECEHGATGDPPF